MLAIIADSHIVPGTPSETAFRAMLDWLSTTDCDVAFLGDVMELWIGLPRYENSSQRHFLKWCQEQREQRDIYFVEGNHEYFVLRHHRRCFTGSATDSLLLPRWNVLLTHGDGLPGIASAAHRRFRWWCKSPLAHFLLSWMPWAPAYVRHLKRKLEHAASKRKFHFESTALSQTATRQLQHDGLRALFYGHFHRGYIEKRRNARLFAVLPAWKEKGEIGLYDPENNRLLIRPWTALAAAAPSRNRHTAPQSPAFSPITVPPPK